MRCAIVLALALVACAPSARSADWFVAHPDELARVIYRCEIHMQTTDECGAAYDATRQKQEARLKLFRKGF